MLTTLLHSLLLGIAVHSTLAKSFFMRNIAEHGFSSPYHKFSHDGRVVEFLNMIQNFRPCAFEISLGELNWEHTLVYINPT